MMCDFLGEQVRQLTGYDQAEYEELGKEADVEKAPPPRGRLDTWPAVRAFVFGGNARFTLVSLKGGARYTYLVKAKKEDLRNKAAAVTVNPDVCYFISLLRGPDNEADYRYMGVAREPGRFWLTAKSAVRRGAPSVTLLLWFLDKMARGRDVLGVTVEFWHEGRCCRCGRALTVPASVRDGVGPECARWFGRAA
jgi:Family of unknown function (DUF6011)